MLSPRSSQSKVFGSRSRSTSPQLSVEPLSTCVGNTTIKPPLSETVISCAIQTGEIVSSTVTSAVHVLELPDRSVTVRVTVFGPKSSQVKSSGVTVNDISSQLSVEPASTWSAVMTTIPAASTYIVRSPAAHNGSVSSTTVTVAVHVSEAPDSSVTVSITMFSPMSSQSNVFSSIVNSSSPQVLVEPPSTSSGRMTTLPPGPILTVISSQDATGGK